MGRPLFSLSYDAAPAVHSEPEPSLAPYEKWNPWNAFDPDSDEFFESENAVYEAFIDPAHYAPHEPSSDDQPIVIIASHDSPESSEGSDSDRGSPMAEGSDDPAGMIADAYSSVDDWGERFLLVGRQLPSFPEQPELQDTNPDVSGYSAPYYPYVHPLTPTTTVPLSMRNAPAIPPSSRTVNITPITVTPANPSSPPVDHTMHFRPSTPPNQLISYNNLTTPSPPPTVTPRIYNWANTRRRPSIPASPSAPPSSSGPLTNPNARMSLAHIAPTLIRVNDVLT